MLASVVAVDAVALGSGLKRCHVPRSRQPSMAGITGMWNSGLEYGKGLFTRYSGFDAWMAPFPDEDRELYPEMFNLPDGVYEVAIQRPLGIAFEEVEPGRGVLVDYLVEGSNADALGVIKPGDVLIATTAVKVIGAKWEVRLIPSLVRYTPSFLSLVHCASLLPSHSPAPPAPSDARF